MYSGWKSYYETILVYVPINIAPIKVQCMEEYLKKNPNNKQAIKDLNVLNKNYESQKTAK
jgi:hypothetical protein